MVLSDLSVYLRLSLQRALLGNVTPNIRAVIAELSGKNISLLFILKVKLMTTMKSLHR